jgi:hypothetical protein
MAAEDKGAKSATRTGFYQYNLNSRYAQLTLDGYVNIPRCFGTSNLPPGWL